MSEMLGSDSNYVLSCKRVGHGTVWPSGTITGPKRCKRDGKTEKRLDPRLTQISE